MNATSIRNVTIPASQLATSRPNDKSGYWLLTLVLVIYGASAAAGSAGTSLLTGI
jgi:hypothetical protein